MNDDSTAIKAREHRLRRRIMRAGLRLKKISLRFRLRAQYGPNYEVLEGNRAVYGCFNIEFEATLAELEWLASTRG